MKCVAISKRSTKFWKTKIPEFGIRTLTDVSLTNVGLSLSGRGYCVCFIFVSSRAKPRDPGFRRRANLTFATGESCALLTPDAERPSRSFATLKMTGRKGSAGIWKFRGFLFFVSS